MTNRISSDAQTSWTWAEQISTYRFWGLLIFYSLSAICITTLSVFLPLYLEKVGLTFRDIGVITAVSSIAGLFGFYIAWFATRWKTIPILIVAGVFQLLGGLIVTVPSLVSNTTLRFLGAFLFGLGAGIIALAVPSIFANGRGGDKAFVVLFGIAFITTRLGEILAPAFMATLSGGIRLYIPAYMIIGLIALFPVKSSLFNSPPPQRKNISIIPTSHNPILEAVLCLLPFYWLYWLYRTHAEVMSVAPSRNILSPHISWLAGAFMPLLSPIIATSLTDTLNNKASELSKPIYRNSWIIFLAAFMFPPVAVALIQSDLNKAIVELPSNAA